MVIKRRGRSSVAMIDAKELSSLLETEHLLSSPKNAERLSKALKSAEEGTTSPSSLAELKKEFGVK